MDTASARLATMGAQAAISLLLFAGCRIVLKRSLSSLLVVAPFVAMVAWTTPFPPPPAPVVLAVVAAALWVWWLVNETPGRQGRLLGFSAMGIAGTAMTLAAVVAPQVVFLTLPLSLYYMLRRDGRQSMRPLVALAALPFAYVASTLVIQECVAEHSTLRETLLTISEEGWTARPWFQSQQVARQNGMEFYMNALFYLPVIPPILVLSARYARRWWFLPTFSWGAIMFAGPIAFEHCVYFYYSQPLQMALLIPTGLVAARRLTNFYARRHASPGRE